MSFNTLQNTPIILDLAQQARSNGWSIVSGVAIHESCNAGYIELRPNVLAVETGKSYTVSYQVANRTSGMIKLSIGNTLGNVETTNGNKTETLVATGLNPKIRFYSDGNLNLKTFDVRTNTEATTTNQTNTIVFSEITNKYTTFLSFTSDYGFSLFKDLFTFKSGRLYKHNQDSSTRDMVYGVQYDSIFKFIANANVGQVKTFESLSYESNNLLITTTDGIVTSLGQISELIADDFLRETLIDGATEIRIYDIEGIFATSFMRDKNDDIVNGNPLKGTYITVELITTNNKILKLRNVMVNSVPSPIGVR
ncbi:hypothetical protein [uncultured Clostridium sp.]|uniref:hypothetical protein n=1 Tax=uncultured Clostridium sp. TaxID=59620 RepID=UPI0026217576|nr:hypothetical protein [uncultured Clostridium sp.]